ncbi:BEL1-like homeodomain protein 11 [Dendrobium catenatum]|uniref:BEL1-like homeodomain protein 11 n=1 Tax=Dendrobium catenatum TaxID=906689 RepID=UPI00109FC005|nr:BEL1-like homeodomain protein 11 [Dendrobium catenatum]
MASYSSQPQELCHCLQCDKKIQNDFLQSWMNEEAGKQESFLGLVHGHGNGNSLSLSLGSHMESMNSYNYKKTHTLSNDISSNSLVHEDVMVESSSSCAEHAKHECMTCDGDAASSGCGSRSSDANYYDSISIVSFVQNSRYLKPAQLLLDEVVFVNKNSDIELSSEEKMDRTDAVDVLSCGRPQFTGEEMDSKKGNMKFLCLTKEKQDIETRITKLVALLEEVFTSIRLNGEWRFIMTITHSLGKTNVDDVIYLFISFSIFIQLERHQQQYFHQMHALVDSFEAIAGTGAAAAYTTLTMKAMSKHFSNLKDTITTHITSASKALSKDLSRNNGAPSLYTHSHSNYKHKKEALQSIGMVRIQQVSRPLRGLPEDSVAVLRAWLFNHFLHPYPSDNEKLLLASQTGLKRNQISNWFINARVRLWKPMIEEMYREEFTEDQQDSNPSP